VDNRVCYADHLVIARFNGADAGAKTRSGDILLRVADDEADVEFLGPAHTFLVGDVVTLTWAGGARYGMRVFAVNLGGTGNDISVVGGSGDAMPAGSTAVTVNDSPVRSLPLTPGTMPVRGLVVESPVGAVVVFLNAAGGEVARFNFPAGGWVKDRYANDGNGPVVAGDVATVAVDVSEPGATPDGVFVAAVHGDVPVPGLDPNVVSVP
jgi:hypothetical protein